MQKLVARFRIVTPMFLAGVDQNKSELREPSIKGAMRFWYRAIDPLYEEKEAELFGGSGDRDGQAKFMLRIRRSGVKAERWDRNRYNLFYERNPKHGNHIPQHATDRRATWQLNGVRYLGFSLFMRDHSARRPLLPGKEDFTLEIFLRKNPGVEQRRCIIASLWLLGHFGGLGTRSRRGFGTLSLQSISLENGEDWPEVEELPLAKDASDTKKWKETYSRVLKKLKQEWFPGQRKVDHTVFGDSTKICLLKTGQKGRSISSNQMEAWEYALDAAGKALQGFRQRWDLEDNNSDYFRVKQHLYAANKRHLHIAGLKPKNLTRAPERAAFGLPLAFRYSSLEHVRTGRNGRRFTKRPNILFDGSGKGRDRSASRIFVRVVQIGEAVYPMFVRMDGLLLKSGDSIKTNEVNGRTFHPPSDDILNKFWAGLPKKEEIEWSSLS